ncbi:MAG TPA: hypothetical protein VL282_14605 [Tepidisphaeraceae bacterium]|jgi:hypothetical protein|nr:hypothetical protein [Tepidisphaeraceae bacterium]
MSQSSSSEMSSAIPCHACGYDVRAQPADGVCPECRAAVSESRRLALIPRRPAWRDSDPRWRRRILAGLWVLVLVPFMAAMKTSGWAASVPVPTFFKVQGAQSLAESDVVRTYAYLTFCIGVVLLFSKERDRQRNRLDWTRRWGVITSYGVFLLGIHFFAFITALVIGGIAALFLSMRRADQPAMTGLLVRLSTGYLRFGPHPSRIADVSLVVFSSVVVLLACVPLYNALRGSGPKALAILLLAPLVLGSLVAFGYVAEYLMNLTPGSEARFYFFYFAPDVLMKGFGDLFINPANWLYLGRDFLLEAGKWLAVLAIALRLTIAQILAAKPRAPDRPMPG